MSLVQSIDLSTDLKLGLYMKIAPKHLFIAQIYGTALGSVVNYSLIRHVIDSKRSFLDGTVIDQWSGRKPEIFFSASVIYGLIGPERFFAGPYRLLYWGFLVGAILPLIPWYLHKRRRRTDPNSSFWSYVSIPLVSHSSKCNSL